MRPDVIVAIVVLVLVLAPAVSAKSDEWALDEQGSSINFSVRHLLISTVTGRFTKFSGTVHYEGNDLSKARVGATIASESINTNNKLRDDHLKAQDVLAVDTYPAITFTSKQVIPEADGSFKIVGDFQLHGVTRQLTLDAEPPKAPHKDPQGRTHISVRASTTIKRKDFDVFVDRPVDKGGALVGDNVNVVLDIDLLQKQGIQ